MSEANADDMLPLVVRPDDEESVVSLVGRTADGMCASFSAMLQYLGIPVSFMLPDESWTRLSRALGVDEATFSAMRRRTIALGRQSSGVEMLGHVFRHFLITRVTLRVCPACMAERRPMLERWNIAHAPVCLRHGLRLVDTCRCGRTLSRRYRGPKTANSCPCGNRFEDLERTAAGTGLLTMGRIVDAAIAGNTFDGLDEQLSGLPLSDLLSITHTVGVASITCRDDDQRLSPRGAVYGSGRIAADLADVASIARLVEAAAPYLLEWSRHYPLLLAQVACRNEAIGTSDADSVFATAIGRTLRRPPRGIDGIPIPCMTSAVEQFCEARFGIKPRKASVRRDSPVARKFEPHLSRRRIATELGVGSQSPALTRIYEEVVRSLDDENAASSKSAEALAIQVEQEVLRRWRNTHDTLSLDDAVRRLSHPRSTHSPEDWIHPDLLVPIDAATQGIDTMLVKRRRGMAFLFSDVEALGDRIALNTEMVSSEADLEGFEPHGRCRKIYGSNWPRTDFLLAFFSGRIPARTLVERPRIADVWFHQRTVRDIALEHRIQAILSKDSFAGAYRCKSIIEEVWGRPAEHLSNYHLRHLRRTQGIRFVDVRNTTEGRDRPLYHYAIADLLDRARILQGSTVAPLVDAVLASYRASIPPDHRITVDAEQMAANEYLSTLAAHVGRTPNAKNDRVPAPNQDRTTPRGWRRCGDPKETHRLSA